MAEVGEVVIPDSTLTVEAWFDFLCAAGAEEYLGVGFHLYE